MGTVRAAPAHTSTMLDALFPATRQRVLGLLFGQPQRAFAMRELIGLAKAGSGAVQREVERLSASGLVVVDGEPRRIRANPASALFVELTGIFEKTGGVVGALQRVLAPMAGQIYFAILYGSVAKGSDRATSDVDVLIVTDALTLEDVFTALAGAEQRLGRAVNPTLYTAAEYHRRRKAKHPFLTKVLGGKHVVLLGSEDAIPAG
ncbi:MAG: nucleotidyltransferase domain-containing protein [Myxococcales bacterium]|nr:nucleotidyltransferase domain-containing protein [Myxococcales bacterium]MBK7196738.1 nucleotidyltransferase domain-containing protein [Myxococcales bacterium]MBP6843848.1 nucleotidyltransferase domain-containing protein [Kofleriaceae bacterium]HQV58297.1 nucleotidyltransferase domain-containing protein [Ilumatobacteraceae bacterium]